jgi:hypothetical protein
MYTTILFEREEEKIRHPRHFYRKPPADNSAGDTFSGCASSHAAATVGPCDLPVFQPPALAQVRDPSSTTPKWHDIFSLAPKL